MSKADPLSVAEMVSQCRTRLGDEGTLVQFQNPVFRGKETFSQFVSERFNYRVFGVNGIKAGPEQMKALVQGDHLKAKDLGALLELEGSDEVRKLVPEHVMSQPFGAFGFVVVSRLPEGERKEKLTPNEIRQLGEFLGKLHGFKRFRTTNETGFLDSGNPDFGDYAMSAAMVYHQMLFPDLDSDERRLIDETVDFIGSLAKGFGEGQTENVIIHKDIFENKLYWKGSELTCLDGWETAQTGPREMELSVIWNRFSDNWGSFVSGYGDSYNEDLLRLCSALQALRFWKSYREHESFVSEQKEAIMRSFAA